MKRRLPTCNSLRLPGHDYRLPRWYFITTNTYRRAPHFGTIESGRMYLNKPGRIVAREWQRTEELRDNVELDAFTVMPDHVHGLLRLKAPRHTSLEMTPMPTEEGEALREFGNAVAHSLSTIIGCFKAAVTRRIHRLDGWGHVEIWQSSFHDHILRTQSAVERTRRYIRTNPRRAHSSEGFERPHSRCIVRPFKNSYPSPTRYSSTKPSIVSKYASAETTNPSLCPP